MLSKRTREFKKAALYKHGLLTDNLDPTKNTENLVGVFFERLQWQGLKGKLIFFHFLI